MAFKGTVLKEIGFHYVIYKTKLVLYVFQLIYIYFYFLVPELFKNSLLNYFCENAS
jgi:hypothetical protein